MIPKTKKGNGFRGVLDYALKKEKGHLIGGNMLGLNPRELSAEFSFARQQNKDKSNPVWHTSLSLKPGEELTDDQWRSATNKFMEQMGFTESHPFVVVKHEDTDHSHVHIIASTISYEGESYKDSFERMKAGAACSKIELEYDLKLVDRRKVYKSYLDKAVLNELEKRFGDTPKKVTEDLVLSKNQRELEKRTGQKSAETKAFEALKDVLNQDKKMTLDDFIADLSAKGITTKVKKYQNSDKIQGLSFGCDGYGFKASKLKHSWKSIQSQLITQEQKKELEHDRELSRTIKDLHGGSEDLIKQSIQHVGGKTELNRASARESKRRNEEYKQNFQSCGAGLKEWADEFFIKRVEGFIEWCVQKINQHGETIAGCAARIRDRSTRTAKTGDESINEYSNIKLKPKTGHTNSRPLPEASGVDEQGNTGEPGEANKEATKPPKKISLRELGKKSMNKNRFANSELYKRGSKGKGQKPPDRGIRR